MRRKVELKGEEGERDGRERGIGGRGMGEMNGSKVGGGEG
jgi:hypothetical protein